MKKILIFLFGVLFYQLSMAQIIDKYGFNVGLAYTNLSLNYKKIQIDDVVIQIDDVVVDYKTGFSIFLTAEKQLTPWISIRPEFGYIQKGFKNYKEFTTSDGENFTFSDDKVIFHDLAINLCIKINPFQTPVSPYLLLGLREDYMFAYRDIKTTEPGSGLTFDVYRSMIEEFNKFNTGALIGLGAEFNDLVYFEFEYNPSLTKSYKSSFLDIKDNCFEARIGLNINKLLK